MSHAAAPSAVAEKADPEAARWAAVLARDAMADGTFYYAVATTGVYCRPSCPSRTAKRENVRFFDTPQAAEAAGFRPCKRCKPHEASLKEVHADLVAAACRRIETAEDSPSLAALSADAGLSPYHFHRIFKAVTGVTPKAYAAAQRRQRVQQALHAGGTVTAAIYDAGFNSSGRFYAASDAALGMRPAAFKAGGRNAVIRFAVGECSLGSILVAATEKGVCAISFGDDPDVLLRDLQHRFPHAELIGGDAAFEGTVAAVVAFVENPSAEFGLPLDIRGTAFQQRVWQALRAIPAGETVTYSDIAARLGEPKAVRAVAGACARNAIAVVIPCHRVVRSDGTLSGYRWGVERKRTLLKREGAV